MKTVPLNIFQKLMRRWDAVHPYNAAQVMKLTGTADRAAWDSAWRATLAKTGLGAVSLDRNRYCFVSLNGRAEFHKVQWSALALDDLISLEMNRRFDDPDEPPFRPFIIQQQDHFYAALVYQHWLADSASIRLLMREWFMHVYDLARVNGSLSLAARGYWDTVGPGRSGRGLTESILDMTRRHIRLRRVQKIASTALTDHTTRFRLIEPNPGLIAQVRRAARTGSVKVNDIFLAALVDACARHVPLQPRRNRRDVAVGSVVDLRPLGPPDLADSFGLFLGFTNVICQPDELRDFHRLLHGVAKQTRLQKSTGVAPSSFIWMWAAMVIGSLSRPDELYHFYRKELPLAAGLSNVDLTKTWINDCSPAPLLDYIRISPTGPMAPLVLTTTTLGEQFHIGMTYRTGLISSERADAVAAAFLARLDGLESVLSMTQ